MNEVGIHPHEEFRYALLDYGDFPQWREDGLYPASQDSFYPTSMDYENYNALENEVNDFPDISKNSDTNFNEIQQRDSQSSLKGYNRRWHYGAKDVSLAAASPSQTHLLSNLGLLAPGKELALQAPAVNYRKPSSELNEKCVTHHCKAAGHIAAVHHKVETQLLHFSPQGILMKNTEPKSTYPLDLSVRTRKISYDRSPSREQLQFISSVALIGNTKLDVHGNLHPALEQDWRVPQVITEANSPHIQVPKQPRIINDFPVREVPQEMVMQEQQVDQPQITNINLQSEEPSSILKRKSQHPSINPLHNFIVNLGFEESTCLVCGDSARWQHYGVLACEGCKGFFKRAVRKHSRFQCSVGEKCKINKQTRTSCPRCRYLKCLRVGMAANHAKGRRRGRKISDCVENTYKAGQGINLGIDEIIQHKELISIPRLSPIFPENSNVQIIQCNLSEESAGSTYYVLDELSPALWDNGVIS